MARAHNFIDISGHRFGRLVVIEHAGVHIQPSGQRKTMWKCKCDCGKEVVVKATNLKNNTLSCGCYKSEVAKETATLHGLQGTAEHKIWTGIKTRCYVVSSTMCEEYGGSDVTMCDRWLEPDGKGFLNFLEDMGERPEGMSINRVGGAKIYSKETCEWATNSIQGYDQKKPISNTSGKVGVSSTKNGTWVAYIDCEKRIHLGTFKTFEEAVAARKAVELKYFGWNKE